MSKIIYKIQFVLLAVFTGLLGSCTPDKYDLEATDIAPEDLVEGIAYTITHDEDNPNIVYLESKMEGRYTPVWNHPQGRSRERSVTLQMPFEGTYEVTFGVETRGGVVYGPASAFTIDAFCADFVTDEEWSLISGGVNESKKWFLDIDANGVSRYFSGPVYFYGLDDSWETVTEGVKLPEEADSWSWEASYKDLGGYGDGWQFTATPMDFGYMEFDLKGNSNVTVVMNDLSRTMTGTYMIDPDNHTLTLTDAELLHDAANDGKVASWSGTMKILSMTENTMQIGVERINDPCLLSFNFISEDYFNNWTPDNTVDTDVVPALDEDWRDYVEPKTNRVVTYTLSSDTPFDWCNLDGSLKGASDAVSAVSGIESLKLVLNSNDGTYTVTAPDGTEVSGDYLLSDDGVYTFSNGLPEVQLSADGRAVFKANADNTLRITDFTSDPYYGNLTDLWLGSEERDAQGNRYQYMGYHFVPESGAESGGREIDVDNAKISCHSEGASDFRIEIYNIYGNTGGGSDAAPTYGANSPIDPYDIIFSSQMTITFTISGLSGTAASQSYDAELMCTAIGWWPAVDAGSVPKTTIQGDGTYTITYNTSNAYENGVIVFCIDIKNMYNDIGSPDDVNVTIDSIIVE